MDSEIVVDEDQLIASLCRDSFYIFVQEFWKEVVPEKPVWNWHIKFLCDELQEAAERVFQRYCVACDADLDRTEDCCPKCQGDDINQGRPKVYDLIINVPPGSTKSTIVSIMFPIWTWCRMPSARHIGGCFAQGLSHDLGRRAKSIFTSDKFQRVFPELEMAKDQSAKSYFMNTSGGSVRRTTVGSVIVGEHAHFHEIDDPIDPEGVHSSTDIAAVNTWCTETIAQRKIDNRITLMILVMQRLHQNDPTGFILKKSKDGKWPIRHLNLPAIRTKEVKPAKVRKMYKQVPTEDGSKRFLFDPVRLPLEVLEQKEDLGQFMYAGQYLQTPVPLGGGMFKTGRLKYGPPPPMREFTKLVRYWDKAATEGGGAYSAGVLVGERWVDGAGNLSKQGRKDAVPEYWILHCLREQWDTDEREANILNTAKTDPKAKHFWTGVEDEGGSAGKDVALMTVRRLAGHKVVMHKPSGDKALRADPVSVQVNGRNVWIAQYGDDRDNWILPFVEEMRYFPNSTYKDQIDALSGAFALIWKRKRAGGIR